MISLLFLSFEVSLKDTYRLELNSFLLLLDIANHEDIANDCGAKFYIFFEFEITWILAIVILFQIVKRNLVECGDCPKGLVALINH